MAYNGEERPFTMPLAARKHGNVKVRVSLDFRREGGMQLCEIN